MKRAKEIPLTADEDDPELSPLCMTRTLHLTLTFLCFTPNWVQMRTMMDAGKWNFKFDCLERRKRGTLRVAVRARWC